MPRHINNLARNPFHIRHRYWMTHLEVLLDSLNPIAWPPQPYSLTPQNITSCSPIHQFHAPETPFFAHKTPENPNPRMSKHFTSCSIFPCLPNRCLSLWHLCISGLPFLECSFDNWELLLLYVSQFCCEFLYVFLYGLRRASHHSSMGCSSLNSCFLIRRIR